jgi:hypothetical protein
MVGHGLSPQGTGRLPVLAAVRRSLGQFKQLEESLLRLRKQNRVIYRELRATKSKPWWQRLLG